MKQTRLEQVCKALGYQGGTHNQIYKEVSNLLSYDVNVSMVLGMSDYQFETLISDIIDTIKEMKNPGLNY